MSQPPFHLSMRNIGYVGLIKILLNFEEAEWPLGDQNALLASCREDACVSAACMYKKKRRKKKEAFLWKEQRRAVWPQWKWMMHLFSAHPQPHLTGYLLYRRVRVWSTLVSSFFICSYCLPFEGLILTNPCWLGGGGRCGCKGITSIHARRIIRF